jgi:amino acid transporter
LPVSEIISARDYALAEAIKPFLGSLGFKVIAIAALFSTASGINATLYGGANVSYMLAKYGELPPVFERRVWGRSTEGLFITAGLTAIFANFFDLSGIAAMSSAALLLIFVAVNVAHLRVHEATGAKPYLLGLTGVACLAFFGALVYYEARTSSVTLYALAIVLMSCFIGELMYRSHTQRMM